MIIDCHTHIFPEAMRKDRETFCRKDKGFSLIYQNPKAKMIGAEELIDSMDASGIDCSVVCGFSWRQSDLCSLHNQYLLESVSRYPGRLIAFISLAFENPEASLKEFENRIREGALGVGEIAFYREGMTFQDIQSMKPILAHMEDRKIPLLLHTNEIVGHDYPGKGSTPLESFYELVLAFPNLPVILGHWGGGLPFYELMPEVAEHMKHVYYDTAASPFLYSKKIYSVVRDIVGAEKIFFGTDYPLVSPRRYFKELKASGLSGRDRKKILGLNFEKKFKTGRKTKR